MQSVFDAGLRHVLHWEGGESNDARDPGGHTNMGTTQRTLDRVRRKHPEAGLPESVSDLTYEHVRFIYRVEYWDLCRCSDLPAAAAIMVLDAAVNQGPEDAGRFLQYACGTKPDGMIGPKTIAAANNCDAGRLVREFGSRRATDYALLDNLDDIYGLGWMRRLFACYDLARTFL